MLTSCETDSSNLRLVLSEHHISLKLSGFDLIFAWHCILIFAPLISNWNYPFADYLWLRQAVLCLCVALAFFLYPLLCQRFYFRVRSMETSFMALFVCMLVISGASTFFALNPLSVVGLLLFSGVVGICEGVLMMFWLTNYYSVTSIETNSGAAQKAVAGTVFCFVLCFTEHIVALIATSLLPILGGIMFLVAVKEYRNESPAVAMSSYCSSTTVRAFYGDELTTAFERSKQHFEIMILLAMVFGVSFGLVQSLILEKCNILLGATNALPMLGAVFAYVCIAGFLKANGSKKSLIFELIFSFIAFSVGALGSSAAGSTVPLVIFGGILVMGFHFFDFAVLAITIDTAADSNMSPILRIGSNRAVVYLSYGSAFLVGHWIYAANADMNIELFSGFLLLVLIVVLALYIAFALSIGRMGLEGSDEPVEDDLIIEENAHDRALPRNAAEPKEEPWLADRPRERCSDIAREYGLTPRESEVLGFLAIGRNAAFIAQALWISPLTAKTHIANIYRKLDIHSMQELFDLLGA